jgi:hypothetical protein
VGGCSGQKEIMETLESKFKTGNKVNQSPYRPEVPRRFQEVKVP